MFGGIPVEELSTCGFSLLHIIAIYAVKFYHVFFQIFILCFVA